MTSITFDAISILSPIIPQFPAHYLCSSRCHTPIRHLFSALTPDHFSDSSRRLHRLSPGRLHGLHNTTTLIRAIDYWRLIVYFWLIIYYILAFILSMLVSFHCPFHISRSMRTTVDLPFRFLSIYRSSLSVHEQHYRFIRKQPRQHLTRQSG
jgi:hypothetical protein